MYNTYYYLFCIIRYLLLSNPAIAPVDDACSGSNGPIHRLLYAPQVLHTFAVKLHMYVRECTVQYLYIRTYGTVLYTYNTSDKIIQYTGSVYYV